MSFSSSKTIHHRSWIHSMPSHELYLWKSHDQINFISWSWCVFSWCTTFIFQGHKKKAWGVFPHVPLIHWWQIPWWARILLWIYFWDTVWNTFQSTATTEWNLTRWTWNSFGENIVNISRVISFFLKWLQSSSCSCRQPKQVWSRRCSLKHEQQQQQLSYSLQLEMQFAFWAQQRNSLKNTTLTSVDKKSFLNNQCTFVTDFLFVLDF